MPLTKQYLTYSAECRYGVITGRKGGALLARGEGGRLVVVAPALEDVKIWDPRTSTVVRSLVHPQYYNETCCSSCVAWINM